MEIRDIIQEIAMTGQPDLIIRLAEVLSVSSAERTCVVKLVSEELELEDVRLQSSEGADSGILIIPVVGSFVMVVVTLIPFICLTTEHESIELGGSGHGGLTITPVLRAELDKTNDLVQALINVINGIPILEPGNGSASVLQSTMKAAIVGENLGSYENIENETVKHG